MALQFKPLLVVNEKNRTENRDETLALGPGNDLFARPFFWGVVADRWGRENDN